MAHKKKDEKTKVDFDWHKPRPNQTTRTLEGKLYHWCHNHQNKKTTNEWGQWVRHKCEDCNNKDKDNTSTTAAPTSGF